jgi:GTP-binding protein
VTHPVVAIVGAPNVGKSTLFNRLVGGRTAIVTSEPGATRDRIYGVVRGSATTFSLVDTGGLTGEDGSPLARGIERQVRAALDEASAVMFVVDARAGLSGLDLEIAAMLRRRSAPILLVANKVDVPGMEATVGELHTLGLGPPIPLSAAHGVGIDDLLDALDLLLEGAESTVAVAPDRLALRIALVGRPNVGKSSILNRILGEDRYLVSEIPGTTRDAVDTILEREGRRYVLVDTAGIRRRGRVERATEAIAVVRARASIRRCDVVVLVVDGSEGIVAQDTHVAGYAQEAGRSVVVVVNKWDLVANREARAKEWEIEVRERLRFVKQAPVLLVSAKTGQRVSRILEIAERVHAAGGIRVPTPELNRWLQVAAARERSSPAAGRSVRLFYATQTGVHPPRFVVFCNDPARVHFSLRRRLENGLRDGFGFGPAAIHLQFRGRRGGREG